MRHRLSNVRDARPVSAIALTPSKVATVPKSQAYRSILQCRARGLVQTSSFAGRQASCPRLHPSNLAECLRRGPKRHLSPRAQSSLKAIDLRLPE